MGVTVCLDDPGHMTEMAAKTIYGRNLKVFLP